MVQQLDVLIIDDEVEMSDLIRQVAEGLELTALSVADAEEFRKTFETRQPRIVVLDLVIPNVNGVELAQWIGRTSSKRNFACRLVIVSGFGEEHMATCRSVAALSGIEDIVTLGKPFEIASLESALLG